MSACYLQEAGMEPHEPVTALGGGGVFSHPCAGKEAVLIQRKRLRRGQTLRKLVHKDHPWASSPLYFL